jgi:hypothetical protein
MKNNKNINPTTTVNRDELKEELRSIFSEIIGGGIKNMGELLASAFCGTVCKTSCETSCETPQPAPAQTISQPAPLPEKDELLKIVSGYLYMALGELKYERKDIMPIMQRVEKYMSSNDYNCALTAYKNAEEEFMAVLERSAPVASSRVVAGVEIPARIHDYRIEQLIYVSNISKTKTANSLKNKGITHVRDLFKAENSNLNNILSVKGKKSFVEALERTVANTPANTPADTSNKSSAPAAKPKAREIPKRDVYSINGVIVPEKMLGKRVDSLKFPSKISRTKLTKKFKEHNIVYIRDFFLEGTPPLYKILSQGGKVSFLEILRNSIVS